jgi:hypothetical protein
MKEMSMLTKSKPFKKAKKRALERFEDPKTAGRLSAEARRLRRTGQKKLDAVADES